MRILFVGSKMPYPPTDGGRIAVFEPLRTLAARGHYVAFLGYGDPAAAQALCAKAGLARVEAVEHDTRTHAPSALLSLVSGLPYTVSKYRSPGMRRRLEAELARDTFDLVQLESTHMALYADLARRAGVPQILRLHNVESLLAERYARTGALWLRPFVALQARRMRRFERWACLQSDLCLAITAEDAARIHALAPEAEVAVSPAGVDLEAYAPRAGQARPGQVAFVGALDWPPNVDAARWFHSQIWPEIKRRVPGARWAVIGKSPSPEIASWPLRDASIEVTGLVADIRPHLAQAEVVVVPLRSGGGMRLKILEAFAMGKVVVSTTLGAEGIQAQEGVHLWRADEAGSFAAEVVRLLGDLPARLQMGRNARSWVESRFSWEAIIEAQVGIYERVLQARGTHGRRS